MLTIQGRKTILETKEVFPLNRKLTVAACVLWLAGIIAFIVGINLQDSAGKWLTVAGEIMFFLGLALQGVLFAVGQKNRAADSALENETPEK